MEILSLIVSVALSIGVPPRLAQELAIQESNLVVDVVGVTGDLGLFQLNPSSLGFFMTTFWNKQDTFDVFDPWHNAYVGLSYLKWLKDKYKFNWWQALVAYNCGPNRVLMGDVPDSSLNFANAIMERASIGYDRFKGELK